jgi:hypothetical protein
LANWIFYFNYESSSCANPISENQVLNQTVRGAELVARSNDDGGETGSDFLLLKLNPIPTAYNPYFAGWTRQDIAPGSGVAIHHPEGDIKKISTYLTSARSSSFSNRVSDTHWSVTWNSTSNGYGVTEVGSSGSGLYDDNKLLTGILTGGSSSCINRTSPDVFGKFSYSWESNGSNSINQLKSWLDPINTGEFAILGTYTGGAIPKDTVDLTIFPNPVSRILFLRSVTKSGVPYTVQLSDFKGNVVLIQEKVSLTGLDENLDVSQLKNGLYLLTILYSDELITEKVLITN